MASVRHEIEVAASADHVWAAVRDVGAVHQRLLPGRVVDTCLEGDVRILTFPHGRTVHELIVDIDDDARRLAYAVTAGFWMSLLYHHATLEVLADDQTRCRLVWVTDVLPHEVAAEVRRRMKTGAAEIRRTLEDQAHDG